MTDAQLIELQPDLLRICGGDEDAVQTLNVNLITHKPQIRDLPRYARSAARREHCNAQRRQRADHRFELLRDEPVDDALSPLDTVIAEEESQRLVAAVAQLPGQQRQSIAHPADRTLRSARYKAVRRLRNYFVQGGQP